MTDVPSRPNLKGALAAGRRQAGLLKSRAAQTELTTSTQGEDAKTLLLKAEARVTETSPLWERAWAASMVRAALKSLDEGPDDSETRTRAIDLRDQLWAWDDEFFGPLWTQLTAGTYRPKDFRAELAARPRHEWDPFTERLLRVDRIPQRITKRPAGMVHYLPSPIAMILDLAGRIGPNDVFYDIGSGLGLVVMLVSWLTERPAVGVEYEPKYHDMALARAEELGFTNTRFVQGDARHLPYEDGTVFYFYDTFRNEYLTEFIEVLRKRAEAGPIQVISRGMSNPVFEAVPWLEVVDRTTLESVVLRSKD